MSSIISAMHVATSGMKVAETDVEVKAHNMSNLNTVGYKRFRVLSADLFYVNLRRPGIVEEQSIGERPVGIQLGTGAKIVGIHRIHDQGIPLKTSNPLDIAIQGMGYFAVNIGNGRVGYTRNGSFTINSTRQIVTVDGYELVPSITIPEGIPSNNIQISQDGAISVTDPQTQANTELGTVSLYTFPNEGGLLSSGSNILEETTASGGPITLNPGESGAGLLLQYNLESSNVNTIEELTSLISAQRAYELCSKVIKIGDEMLQTVNQVK